MTSETQEHILTRSGYERLQQELNAMIEQDRGSVDAFVAEMHEEEQGDEALFFDAMVAKEQLESRITYLKYVLATAKIIDDDDTPDRVTPGNRVTILDLDQKEEFVLDLIGGAEATLGLEGVSIDSPVGKALLGGRIGDRIKVDVPDGLAHYEIRAISMIPRE
jgi:transcription elongation factor GreA